MRILITGGAGYVGAVLVPVLLRHGHRVRVLDNLYVGGHGLIPCVSHPGFEFIRSDICNAAAVQGALEDVEMIIHLAAVVGYPACMNEPDRAVSTNVNGTKLLLDLRRMDQRVVFASTGSVYGMVPSKVCSELTPSTPLSLYGTTKLEAERMVLEAGNSVAFRYATAFGPSPRMRFDLLPNNFVRQAIQYGRVAVYEGSYRRTFIHVQDMASSMIFAIDSWKAIADDVFNVGNEDLNCSKASLARRIQRLIPFDLRFDDVDSDSDRRDYEVSYRKIRSHGFVTRHTIDSGLADLVMATRLMGFDRPFCAGGR